MKLSRLNRKLVYIIVELTRQSVYVVIHTVFQLSVKFLKLETFVTSNDL